MGIFVPQLVSADTSQLNLLGERASGVYVQSFQLNRVLNEGNVCACADAVMVIPSARRSPTLLRSKLILTVSPG